MKSLLLVLALLGAAVAVPKSSQRIVGGNPTTVDHYPFMCAMHYGWFGFLWYQACGGALITRTAVLSAAHCYHGDHPSSWRIQCGSSEPETGGTVRPASQLRNHANYHPNTLDYDVAIVIVDSAFPIGGNIGVAQIAGPNYVLPTNTPIWAVGWGTLSSGGSSPDILHHVEVFTIDWQLCADRYAYLKTQPGYQNWPDITYTMACAGILDVGGADACQGDSGGPVVHNRNVVYGITSWGFGCGHAFYPGVMCAVRTQTGWIQANA